MRSREQQQGEVEEEGGARAEHFFHTATTSAAAATALLRLTNREKVAFIMRQWRLQEPTCDREEGDS